MFRSALLVLASTVALPALADEPAAQAAGGNCFVTTERYDLYYPVTRRVHLEGIGLRRRCEEALAYVERRHGAIHEKVFFTVHDRDTFGNPDSDLHPALCRRIDQGIQVLLTPWAVNDETLRHELMHAWLIGQGFTPDPPPWLHEGLAYCEQYEDHFDERWFALLLEEGPLTLAELEEEPAPGAAGNPNRRYASGWAVVYYTMLFEERDAAEVIVAWRTGTLVEPKTALQTIARYREKAREVHERAEREIADERRRIVEELRQQ